MMHRIATKQLAPAQEVATGHIWCLLLWTAGDAVSGLRARPCISLHKHVRGFPCNLIRPYAISTGLGEAHVPAGLAPPQHESGACAGLWGAARRGDQCPEQTEGLYTSIGLDLYLLGRALGCEALHQRLTSGAPPALCVCCGVFQVIRFQVIRWCRSNSNSKRYRLCEAQNKTPSLGVNPTRKTPCTQTSQQRAATTAQTDTVHVNATRPLSVACPTQTANLACAHQPGQGSAPSTLTGLRTDWSPLVVARMVSARAANADVPL